MEEKTAFFQIQSINTVSSIMENRIAKPITKRMEIIIGIKVCLIWRMNIDFKENGGRESFFLPNQSINIVYPNEGNKIIVPNHKMNEGCYENLSFTFWQAHFDYKENVRKKSFSC